MFSDKKIEALKDKERIHEQLEQDLKKNREKMTNLFIESSKLKNQFQKKMSHIIHSIQKTEDEAIRLDKKLQCCKRSSTKTLSKPKSDSYENPLTTVLGFQQDIKYESEVKENRNFETNFQKLFDEKKHIDKNVFN